MTPFDIIVALDISGSMNGQPLEQAKDASRKLFGDMIDLSKHRAGLVSYDSTAVVRSSLTNDKNKLQSAVSSLSVAGSTNMAAGIEYSVREFRDSLRQRVLILITDGVPDSEPCALREAENAKLQGIRIVTIGIGVGSPTEMGLFGSLFNSIGGGSSNFSLLERIATTSSDCHTGGDFSQLTSIFKEITGSLQTI